MSEDHNIEMKSTPAWTLPAIVLLGLVAAAGLVFGWKATSQLDSTKADVAALEDVLLRVSALVEAHPEIAEMDLNPLIVRTAGALAVDARIRLEGGAIRKPIGAR